MDDLKKEVPIVSKVFLDLILQMHFYTVFLFFFLCKREMANIKFSSRVPINMIFSIHVSACKKSFLKSGGLL